jgi:two-component system, chemotaxis family, protein-glutamate methylesterase/glutaminase
MVRTMPAEGGARRDLVVIGSSAGGVDTLKRVVSGLPPDLAASVCVVMHIAPSSPSALARILARSGPLACRQATDGEPLRAGQILVAPPDRHLVIEDNHVRLTVGPRENGHRPAVDALFRSAAMAADGRVVGVVLSGNQDDGTAGLAAIKARGGATIVQDPEDALYRGMPASAVANVKVDAVVSSEGVASAIAAMVNTYDPPFDCERDQPPQTEDRLTLPCPDCGGVLSEERDAGVPVWRCRVGHRYSPDHLVEAQASNIESALWAAIRALEDRIAVLERLAGHMELRSNELSARNFRGKARAAREQAGVLRDVLAHASTTSLSSISDIDAGKGLVEEA